MNDKDFNALGRGKDYVSYKFNTVSIVPLLYCPYLHYINIG